MYDLPRTTFGGMQHITYLEENHNQLWDDTLMMTVMPLAKIGKLLDRPHYVEEASGSSYCTFSICTTRQRGSSSMVGSSTSLQKEV